MVEHLSKDELCECGHPWSQHIPQHGWTGCLHCTCQRTSNHHNEPETNRDKVLRGEVVKVTDSRLREMQRIAIANEGIGYGIYHWHWAAAMNELLALRAEVGRLRAAFKLLHPKPYVWRPPTDAEAKIITGTLGADFFDSTAVETETGNG